MTLRIGKNRRGMRSFVFLKKIFFSLFLFYACSDAPKPPPELKWVEKGLPPSTDQSYLIVSSKSNGDIPDWTNIYLNSGISGIELIAQYKNSYVFIKEVKGHFFTPLLQWLNNFSLEREFPRLVAERIQLRFTKNIKTYPDAEYGGFFESAVKAFSNARYESAVKEDDFWIEKNIFQENGAETQIKEFSFFVLITIDKKLLKSQIDAILDPLTPDDKLSTKAQIRSVQYIKEHFFEGF